MISTQQTSLSQNMLFRDILFEGAWYLFFLGILNYLFSTIIHHELTFCDRSAQNSRVIWRAKRYWMAILFSVYFQVFYSYLYKSTVYLLKNLLLQNPIPMFTLQIKCAFSSYLKFHINTCNPHEENSQIREICSLLLCPNSHQKT